MEDGLERSSINYENENNKEIKYIYIFSQSNGNYIIIFDKYKAIGYSQQNYCRIDIFIESEGGVYTYTKKYFKNGVLTLDSI
jgi:hypothetical protein